MNRLKQLLLFALLAFGPTTWAQDWTEVNTENALNAAIADGTYIKLTADITLSEYLKIGQNVEQIVTIDLNGHTLQRTGLTGPDANGHVIEVFSNGTLSLRNGTLTGGWANNGGGICNKGALTLNNVTITGCKANEGGAIKNNTDCNMSINGCTITGNTATTGGGIWSNGVLWMQGNVTIKDNADNDDVFLKSGKMITVLGALTGGANSIGVYMEAPNTFTIGYTDSETETNPFFSNSANPVVLEEGECKIQLGNTYISCSWDEVNKKVVRTTATIPDGASVHNIAEFGDGYSLDGLSDWIIVSGNLTINKQLTSANTKMLLMDGAQLTLKNGIVLDDGFSLTIYCQSYGSMMGKLIISVTEQYSVHAGIGGTFLDDEPCPFGTKNCGRVEIHGGDLHITGGNKGAAIGGSWGGNGGTVFIYDGRVEAHGGGSGIGGGEIWTHSVYQSQSEETHDGAHGGELTVYGGKLYAYGDLDCSGIGSGDGNGFLDIVPTGGTVTIHGGYVYAKGGGHGAGIGGGRNGNGGNVTINGGTVLAYGGADAAGIGSGEQHNGNRHGGTLTVNGGYVFADGTDWGAGIGGGEDADGADVIINGGIVEAWAGDDAGNKNGSAIGSEDGDGHYGTLTLGNGMMVHAGDDPSHAPLFDAPYRVPACRWRKYARVEPCNHQGATYTINGTNANGTHTLNCSHCLSNTTEHHTFEGEICTVCHVHGETCTVDVYLPEKGEGNTYSYGTNPKFTHTLVKGSKFELPSASLKHLPKGVRFVGWREGDPITLGLTSPEAEEGEALLPAGNEYTVNASTSFTGRYKRFPIFITTGNWNEAGNWYGNEVPAAGSDVIIDTTITVTIPNGYTADAGDITIDLGGSLVIEEGGQLLHSNERVPAMVRKSITAYTVPSGAGLSNGWYFITLPVYTGYTPDATMLSNTYDLYRLNGTTWENFKAHDDFTTLDIGYGYLYANSTDVTLNFTGPLLPYNKRVADHNNAVVVQSGWNLMGNPFVCNAYANRPFYKMNTARTGIVAVENYWNTDNYIAPCTGFVVHANAGGVVWLTHTPPQAPASSNHGSLQIVLSQAVEPVDPSLRGGTTKQSSTIDNAIVSFNEGSTLPKFRFGDNAEIYIPQNGEDYAIAYSEGQGEMPLNFKAKENGQYTISVNPEGVVMSYLHLIDNMTGTDVDLLAVPTYSFSAKTSDYASRFRMVFANENQNDNENFAFISNGNIIVNGEGTMQIIDALGRIVRSEQLSTINYQLSTSNFTPGVYVLRLINGDNVKTQKMVVE